LKGGINIMRFDIEGYRPDKPDETNVCEVTATAGYVRALGLYLVAGRDFTQADGPPPRVAIVNQAFARRFFGNQDPMGKRLRYVPGSRPEMEIVGMVRDQKYMSLREEARPLVYVPHPYHGEVTYYVRTDQRPEALIAVIRREAEKEAPGMPVYDLRTMESQASRALRGERLIATLSGFFAFLATMLAGVGLYGVMAYVVARRTREIGIRMALGAVRANVLWMVMKEVSVMIGFGLLLGLPTAFGLVRLVEFRLYGIPATDPLTMAAAAIAVAFFATLAGFLPAQGASRVDAVVALRYE